MNIYSKSINDIEKHTESMFLDKTFFKNIYKNNSLNKREKKQFKVFYKQYIQEKKEFNLHLLEKYKIGEIPTTIGGNSYNDMEETDDEEDDDDVEDKNEVTSEEQKLEISVPRKLLQEYQTEFEIRENEIFEDDANIDKSRLTDKDKAILKCRGTIFYNLNGKRLPIDLFNQCVNVEQDTIKGKPNSLNNLKAFKIKLSCLNDYNIDYKTTKELSKEDIRKIDTCIQMKMKNEDLIIDTTKDLQYKIKEHTSNFINQTPRLIKAIPVGVITILNKIGILNLINLQISQPTTIQMYTVFIRWMIRTVCMTLQQYSNDITDTLGEKVKETIKTGILKKRKLFNEQLTKEETKELNERKKTNEINRLHKRKNIIEQTNEEGEKIKRVFFKTKKQKKLKNIDKRINEIQEEEYSDDVTVVDAWGPWLLFDEIMQNEGSQELITLAWNKGIIAMNQRLGSFIDGSEGLIKVAITSGLNTFVGGVLAISTGGSSYLVTSSMSVIAGAISSIISNSAKAASEEFAHYYALKKNLDTTFNELDNLAKVIIGCFLPTLYNQKLIKK